MTSEQRTALVLGGGGPLGALQVGFIERISELGIPIDFVVGTSVGALNAAHVAFHEPEDHNCLRDVWLGHAGARLFHRSPLRIARQLWRSRLSLYDGTPIVGLVRQHLQRDDFLAARIPLHVTATNLCDGQRHIFSEGSILAALRASTAVPGLFPPLQMNGATYVDGAVSAPVDVDAAIELGATQIIALDLRPKPTHRSPQNLVDVVMQSWSIAREQLALCDAEHQDRAVKLVHIRPGIQPLHRWSLGEVEDHLAVSREMAEKSLDLCWDGTHLRPGHFHFADDY